MLTSSVSGVKRPRSGGENDDDEPDQRDEQPAFSEYSLPRPVGKRERQTDSLVRRSSVVEQQLDTGDDDADEEETPMRERWTHPITGDTFEYPLSAFLEPALSGSRNADVRLVVFRVNHGSPVAPFLEFLLAAPSNGRISHTWPAAAMTPPVEPEKKETAAPSEHEQEDDEDERRAAAHQEGATNTVRRLVHSLPGDGRQVPRFCGAWSSSAAATEYAWFQVDAATAPANHVWVTVHELVRLGRGPSLDDFKSQPLLWCICDRGVPVEIPITLEPLLFQPTTAAAKLGVDDAKDKDGEKDKDDEFDEQTFAVETNRANYVGVPEAGGEFTPSDHALFGRTLYAFHDPFWDLFVAAAAEKSGAPPTTTTTTTASAQQQQYAVFMDKTLYLIGECPRENAALLAFADTGGYSSVYLPTSSPSSFVWLVQSSDQFVLRAKI